MRASPLSRRGFSLPELILGFGILLLFMGAVFGLFTKGYQAFHFLQTRQSVQGQMLRMKTVLETDFRLSHYRSIGTESRSATVEGQSVRRDQACCLILDDWRNPANYRDATSIPLWNRYAVYQTSLDPEGRLERVVVAPNDPIPLRCRPLADLTTLTDPTLGRQVLSSNIASFECQKDAFRQEIVVTFVLKEVGGSRGLDQNKIAETFKAVFHWLPNNTVPRF